MKPLGMLPFLRPYLHRENPAIRGAAFLRLYSQSQPRKGISKDTRRIRRGNVGKSQLESAREGSKADYSSITSTSKDVSAYLKLDGPKAARVAKLNQNNALQYPRIDEVTVAKLGCWTCKEFIERLKDDSKEGYGPEVVCSIRGRVHHIRKSGSKLVFIDIIQDGHKVQISCNLNKMRSKSCEDLDNGFRQFFTYLNRGDIICVTGQGIREDNGTLSLLASSLPTILTPSIAPLPFKLDDTQTRMRNRHVDMLLHPSVADTLRLRSHIIQSMRQYFLDSSSLEVQTPILASLAGGAIARPFTTFASEFPDKKLAMRIAPEIWLKRLIIGGFERVFEIGPVFRNEGLDGTHNPEFTTCEFYQAYASFEELISMTEELMSRLLELSNNWRFPSVTTGEPNEELKYKTPYNRLSFIPTIEVALKQSLPALHTPTAFTELLTIFENHSLALPLNPTLPTLLDRLSTLFIEPLCKAPTFITHHPSLLAPLSKEIFHQATGQYVSLRAELFIHGKEMANMYEEENSPFAQYAKFVSQQEHKASKAVEEGCGGGGGGQQEKIDESYIRALEYGLPPTGGWGAGVDRILMLLAGKDRISDVLAFGNLKNVVGLGVGG